MAGWESCYIHPKWMMILSVYVDDFKMAGPAENMAAGWKLIRKGIKMEDPTPFGLYLGCYHETFECDMRGAPDGKARGVVYNCEALLKKCVDRYLELVDCEYEGMISDVAPAEILAR